MKRVVGAVAALVSIAIHALLIESVLLSEGGRQPRVPHEQGLGANAVESDIEAAATLILIEDPDSGPRSDDLSQELVASLGKVVQNLRLTIITPTATYDFGLDDDSDTTERTNAAMDEAAADREGQAALFGNYLMQIRARIERGWLRPRTPIGAASFDCRVQIQQSARGEVQEITLQRCNGDQRWQLSLVLAIERASPLPAPPKPSVFSSAVQLSFESHPYVPGGDTEQYEPTIEGLSADNSRTTQFP